MGGFSIPCVPCIRARLGVGRPETVVNQTPIWGAITRGGGVRTSPGTGSNREPEKNTPGRMAGRCGLSAKSIRRNDLGGSGRSSNNSDAGSKASVARPRLATAHDQASGIERQRGVSGFVPIIPIIPAFIAQIWNSPSVRQERLAGKWGWYFRPARDGNYCCDAE